MPGLDFDFESFGKIVSIQLVPFVMAVVFHEYAHGYVALKWGDKTAQEAGRLTLNPIPHVHPFGTILLPLLFWLSGLNILIGAAKPVPINPRRFKKYRPGLFWVSFAGPLMNFILAAFFAFFWGLVLFAVPSDFYLFDPLVRMAQFGVLVNYALGIFNLMPLPPLDGSKMIEAFLSPSATQQYEKLAQYSFFILLALIFTGVLRFLFYPIHLATEVTLKLSAYFFVILETLLKGMGIV